MQCSVLLPLPPSLCRPAAQYLPPAACVAPPLPQVEPGSKISLGRVLALKSGGKFSVGQPYLENVAVHAEVLEELKGPKASTKHELHESACSLHAWARAGMQCWEGEAPRGRAACRLHVTLCSAAVAHIVVRAAVQPCLRLLPP